MTFWQNTALATLPRLNSRCSACCAASGRCSCSLMPTKSQPLLSRASALVSQLMCWCFSLVLDDKSSREVDVDKFWKRVCIDLLISGKTNGSLPSVPANCIAPFMGHLSRRPGHCMHSFSCRSHHCIQRGSIKRRARHSHSAPRKTS